MLDNRTHYHLGFTLFFISEEGNSFSVAISEKQQMKYEFSIGDVIQGSAWTKLYPEREFADYYRAGTLKILK